MSTPISPSQYRALEEAIAAAQGPGSCTYVVDDKPHCVVACYLSAADRVSLAELNKWDKAGYFGGAASFANTGDAVGGFDDSPLDNLLLALQESWDNKGKGATLDVARERLSTIMRAAQ